MTIPVLQVPQRPSSGQKASNAVGALLQGLNQYQQQQQQQQHMEAENEAAARIGLDLRGVTDPKVRQQAFQQAFQQGFQNENNANELQGTLRDYQSIEEQFGKQFADVWKATPTGGRTELIKHALDAAERGESVQDLLSNIEVPEEQERIPDKVPQLKKGKVAEEFEWPDFTKRPKGFTRKEWSGERKNWRKENAPVFDANKTKLDSTNADILATKKLNQLNQSGKLPEGLDRLIINPETGEPYGIAQLAGTTPEVQEWVKTISRFQNRAKDSFGSRVTNFDLVSYMKQFPGLINTTEGRKRILEMMNINYDMDKLYNSALDQIYKHYGLGNIPQEMADELARKMIEEQTEKLRREYLGLDAVNKEETQPNQQSPAQGNRPSLDEIFG